MKKIRTMVKTLMIGALLFVGQATSAFAANGTWIKHADTINGGNSWEYVYSNGTCASGWQKIDGSWYYFDPYDGTTFTGQCWFDSKGLLDGDIAGSMYNINGENYWFDNNGRLLTNCHVTSGGRYVYYVDSNGHATQV